MVNWFAKTIARHEITALHLSTLSPHLLLGTQASQIVVLALPSLQPIRTFSPTQSMSVPLPNPITYISTLIKPSELVGVAGMQRDKADDVQPRPAAQLARAMEPLSAKTDKIAYLRIGAHADVRSLHHYKRRSPLTVSDYRSPACYARRRSRRLLARFYLLKYILYHCRVRHRTGHLVRQISNKFKPYKTRTLHCNVSSPKP